MNHDPRHPLVLAVDDDADTRELYHLMLESVGYRVDSAGSVRGALDAAARRTPDVVISDWRLPDGDALAVSNGFRARHALRRVPLVAVTGMTLDQATLGQARERGFVATLLKPAAPDEILRALRVARETETARVLRAAARRLRLYAASAGHAGQGGSRATARLDATMMLERVAARSGDNVTLMLADDSAHYVAAAGTARELTGYEPRELLSLSVWDLTPPPDTASGQGLWTSFISSGSQEGRYMLRRRDGKPVEAQYYAVANVLPGLHVSAIAQAAQLRDSL
jgi:PAS domain S-box-containing protein